MIRYLDEIELKGKRVLLRLDLNVPLDKDTGQVLNFRRVDEALASILYCLQKGAQLIICSHLGRPKGKLVPFYSLEPVGKYISEKLKRDVILLTGELNDGTRQISKYKRGSEIILLENLRFFPGEERNHKEFSLRLASLADVYINDAFGTCHRKHASIYGVPQFCSQVGAGFLIRKELKFLSQVVSSPKQPMALLLGGAKVTDKLAIVENLVPHLDKLLIGGAMAYVFLREKGYSVGTSIVEEEGVRAARSILKKVERRKLDLCLPKDHVVLYPGKEKGEEKISVLDTPSIPETAMGLDIGPGTVELFTQSLKGVRTLLWNGPLGLCERSPFHAGTEAVSKFLGTVSAVKVLAGGDTVSTIQRLGKEKNFNLLSTGGGATLKFLEGKEFPGIDVLERNFPRENLSTTEVFNLDEEDLKN